MKAIKYRLANILLILIAFLMLISACSNMSSMGGHGKSNNDDDVPEVTAVQISSIPEIMNSGESVKIQAKVTQGLEVVDDARKVEFELWKRGQKDHELVKAKYEGKGIYGVEKTFAEDGIYYVIAHVTARDMHNMPLKELIVGNVSAKELAEARASKKEASQLENDEM